jgi:hypothetical protein
MTPPRTTTFTNRQRWSGRLRAVGFICYMTLGMAVLAFLVR